MNFFEPDEWITMKSDHLYIFNDGAVIDPLGFLLIFMNPKWEKGWELV